MNIKTKLNTLLIFSIFIALFISGFFFKDIVKNFAIAESVDKATIITQQLLATRHYLSTIASDIEIKDKKLNPFIISPAYVGGEIGETMLKQHNFYIKQTSLEYRNKNNRPDDFERGVLEKYKDKKISNQYYEITPYNNKDYLRYTYPLFITKNCLQCHGKPYTDVKETTYNSLVKLYGEKAFNYKLGDLRGMISVAIDIEDIEYTTTTLNQSMYITLIILFIVITTILVIDFQFIYMPQIRRIEEKVKQEIKDKEYLDLVTESNNEAIIAIDENKTILTYNKKAQEIFGFSKEEMIGTKNLLNIIPLKYKNLHTVATDLYFKTGKSKGILGTTLELEASRKDGRIIPIRISFGTNNDTNHKIVVANISDLTVTKVKEEQIAKEAKIAQDKVSRSLTLFGDNVLASSSNLEGNLTYVSQALCNMSGFTQEELLGQPNEVLIAPDISTQKMNKLLKTINSGDVWNGEIKSRKKDGSYYWVTISILPDFDIDGNIIGFSSIRHDITSEKAKEEFMANMSHELRTPLNAIIGFSSLLGRKINDEKNLEFVQHINSSSKALLGLINDILDLSKIKDSKFKIEPYEFNAYDEMIEYTKRFEGLTAKKKILFNNNISQKLKGKFFGDWIRISQIILNIISNSIKFTAENGTIIFDTDYKDDSLILNISDNGIGMNKEVQDKIFKPFEQADGSTTRKYGGTGLGLSITQSLVELMNGKIELISQEGVGTTFTITLPLEKKQNIQENQKQILIDTEDQDNKNLNIHLLVVEDNKTNQLLIKMLLEEFGSTCDIANDGIEAINLYNPDIHKLVLMDENMPNMNGIEAMRILKNRFKERCTPIIALTANNMKGDEERFLKLGMDGYVSKPIDEDELFISIQKLII